jgi:TatD DNase family protein
MIDTHCHLTDTRLGSQLQFVLGRAAAAGVDRMITIGTELEDSRQCVEVCRGRANVACAVGVHPNYVDQVQQDDLGQLREIASDASVVALGEMGLDYHYGKESRQRQVKFFEFQLGLAGELNKPVVIHSREAIDDCLAIMRNFPMVRAVYHCFTGTLAEAKRILDSGYLLGFTGVITFKNGDELREAVKMCPADRLLVETDAPYLSPEPMRKQKVNEPALVMHVAAMVGQLRNLTVAEVDEMTTGNAEAFFGKFNLNT